jgi:uracil-DNA glycosylase family 4
MSQLEDKALHALLAWYEAMGVDEAIGEEPVDRFAAVVRKTPVAPATSGRQRPMEVVRASPSRTAPADGAATSAAATLSELEALVEQFEGCSLKRTAKSLCFARGGVEAKVMMIGEAPGRDEDLQGKPFVGRAGQLLDRMLAAIGLGEAEVYITNTVYWRPPGNRTPTPEEVEACAPFLARQIELLSPRALVLLGGAAAKTILGTTEGIMRLRGKWLTYASPIGEVPALAMLHPAYLLRNPAAKRYAWRDLLMLKAAIDSR